MSEELRPCPFCGLHVELVSAKTYPNGERSPAYIKCKRCNYHIAGYEDKDVINQWNTRSAIRKEFCPNCEAETPCTHEAELFVCDICGEDFAKYIVSRNCNVSDVSITQDVLTDVKTPRSIENNNPDYYKDELYLDEDFRMLSKTYPADVSAIGVTTLIDYAEALEAELARRTASLHYANTVCMEQKHVIDRLKEDAERLATRAVYWDDYGKEYECIHLECSGHSENILFDHAPDCPITLHRALMKELE